LMSPSREPKLLDKRTTEHQGRSNHRHPLPLLPPLNKERRKETSPPAEQCKILAIRNFQGAAQISSE